MNWQEVFARVMDLPGVSLGLPPRPVSLQRLVGEISCPVTPIVDLDLRLVTLVVEGHFTEETIRRRVGEVARAVALYRMEADVREEPVFEVFLTFLVPDPEDPDARADITDTWWRGVSRSAKDASYVIFSGITIGFWGLVQSADLLESPQMGDILKISGAFPQHLFFIRKYPQLLVDNLDDNQETVMDYHGSDQAGNNARDDDTDEGDEILFYTFYSELMSQIAQLSKSIREKQIVESLLSIFQGRKQLISEKIAESLRKISELKYIMEEGRVQRQEVVRDNTLICIKKGLHGVKAYSEYPLLVPLDRDVVLIEGLNGSGKSSFVEGLIWALTGKVPRWDEWGRLFFIKPSNEGYSDVRRRSDKHPHFSIHSLWRDRQNEQLISKIVSIQHPESMHPSWVSFFVYSEIISRETRYWSIPSRLMPISVIRPWVYFELVDILSDLWEIVEHLAKSVVETVIPVRILRVEEVESTRETLFDLFYDLRAPFHPKYSTILNLNIFNQNLEEIFKRISSFSNQRLRKMGLQYLRGWVNDWLEGKEGEEERFFSGASEEDRRNFEISIFCILFLPSSKFWHSRRYKRETTERFLLTREFQREVRDETVITWKHILYKALEIARKVTGKNYEKLGEYVEQLIELGEREITSGITGQHGEKLRECVEQLTELENIRKVQEEIKRILQQIPDDIRRGFFNEFEEFWKDFVRILFYIDILHSISKITALTWLSIDHWAYRFFHGELFGRLNHMLDELHKSMGLYKPLLSSIRIDSGGRATVEGRHIMDLLNRGEASITAISLFLLRFARQLLDPNLKFSNVLVMDDPFVDLDPATASQVARGILRFIRALRTLPGEKSRASENQKESTEASRALPEKEIQLIILSHRRDVLEIAFEQAREMGESARLLWIPPVGAETSRGEAVLSAVIMGDAVQNQEVHHGSEE